MCSQFVDLEMKDKRDIELSVFKKPGDVQVQVQEGQCDDNISYFNDDIEFINFDKKQISLTDRIKNITKISNKELLFVTTIFFTIFVICEVIGGLASNSLSLLGDAGAMTIDVFSYGFNFLAEYMKSKDNHHGIKNSATREFFIEIVIPGISVLSLLGVTGW